MRRIVLIATLIIGLMLAVTITAQDDFAPDNQCPPEIAPRLVIGELGRVLADVDINIREQPRLDIARLGFLRGGSSFTVLDGYVCNAGYVWWQVEYTLNEYDTPEFGTVQTVTGWVAEGDPSGEGEYWLEPRGLLVIQTDEDGNEIAYVEDADGNLERAGCLRPPDDYRREQIGYATLNIRTLAMLDHAQRLYEEGGGGIVNFRQAITQGSYNAGGVSASFGTHDGGGAVDISVRSPMDWSILSGEIAPMLDALRVAGFAAWLRDTGELYDDSPIHIHAIAIGDADLSDDARAQIDGEYGYLRGYNGLPEGYSGPALDIYGDPIICGWMVEMGFDDLRELEDADSDDA